MIFLKYNKNKILEKCNCNEKCNYHSLSIKIKSGFLSKYSLISIELLTICLYLLNDIQHNENELKT